MRICVLVCVFFSVLWPNMATAGTITAIRVDKNGLYGVRLIITSNEKPDYRIYAAQDPYRLIVDLPGSNFGPIKVEKYQNAEEDVKFGIIKPSYGRIIMEGVDGAKLKAINLIPSTQNPKIYYLFVEISYAQNLNLALHSDIKIQAPRMKPSLPHVPDTNFELSKLKPSAKPSLPKSQQSTPQSGTIPLAKKPPAVVADPALVRAKKSLVYRPIIVLDAGHGAHDDGTSVVIRKNRIKEKDIVLRTAHELKRALEASGLYRVYLTRADDSFIELRKRFAIADFYNADLFLSIHVNSNESSRPSGFSIYTLSEGASDREADIVAAKENASHQIAGIDVEDVLQGVDKELWNLRKRESMTKALIFADKAVKETRKTSWPILRNPKRQAGFMVLKGLKMPSALLEMAFLSNARDRDYMLSDKKRGEWVSAIARAVHLYFEDIKLKEK